MTTAILLPVTLGAASLAVDVSSSMASKRHLQDAADAAALATASALADGKIDTSGAAAFAKDFVVGQMANYLSDTTALKDATTVTATKSTSGTATSYAVSVSSTYTKTLSGLAQVAGFKTTNIGASSQTVSGYSEAQGSISMYLVLDKSLSMNEKTSTTYTETYDYSCGSWFKPKTCTGTKTSYYKKIEALKLAVASLTAQIESADPTHIYSRMGAVSYSTEADKETPLAWGTSAAKSYVDALSPSGFTNSSGAMEVAYDALTNKNYAGNDTEDKAHKDKTGQTPTKYIVFMTDGANNQSSADTNTKKTCDAAKAKGLEIYSVAFMAEQDGQKLLRYCATNISTHYFEPESMAELVAAFKKIGAKATEQNTRLIN